MAALVTKRFFFEGRKMIVNLMCSRKICDAKHTYAHMHTHITPASRSLCIYFSKNNKNSTQEFSWKCFELKYKNYLISEITLWVGTIIIWIFLNYETEALGSLVPSSESCYLAIGQFAVIDTNIHTVAWVRQKFVTQLRITQVRAAALFHKAIGNPDSFYLVVL